MIFKTKVRTVEAERIPEDPNFVEMTKIKGWLADHGFNFLEMRDDKVLVIYSRSRVIQRVRFGKWIVISGGERVESLTPEEFTERYEWTGPKVYADAPYLVN